MRDEIQLNDILMTSEAPMGEVLLWKTDEKIVLSQRLFALRAKDDVSPNYLYYYFISRKFKFELKARASGTTVVGIRQTELIKTKIVIPPLLEQKAIAQILTAFTNSFPLYE
jgi:type I restriction enzyme S subunit